MTYPRSFIAIAALATLVAVLAVPTAGAGNAGLKVALDTWSRKIGVDAHSVALSAQRRHPRRMTRSALRFRADALRAHKAIAAQKPSTAPGRKAKSLALTAFTDYAVAGSRWAASGRARVRADKPAASRYAAAGARYAKAGNRLLLSAGRLIR